MNKNKRGMNKERIIKGRPDLTNHAFGITKAKKFPPYVYSTNTSASLIHRVRYVELRWYEVFTRDSLKWLNNPNIMVITKCSQQYYLKSRKGKGFQMCEIPDANAVMCGSCSENKPTFKKGVESSKARKIAHTRLGCVSEVTSIK